MTGSNQHTRKAINAALERLADDQDDEHATAPLPPRVPGATDHSEDAAERRRDLLEDQGIQLHQLVRDAEYVTPESLAGNIENFVGFARIPIGVVGPLRIRGAEAQGDFYVPMATTEGAMIASYQRGVYAISRSGGATTICLEEAVSRSPVFVFDRLATTGAFLAWLLPNQEKLQDIVSTTSRYCKLSDLKTHVVGKEVYLGFEFTTGDASGQNMVTIATEAICKWILANAPVKPTTWLLEANCSGDKKASWQSLLNVRGKKVVADVVIDRKTVSRFLHTDPETMCRYWDLSATGAFQSGTVGLQGHYANAIAGLFIATGQDVACVSEAHVGITRIDMTQEGDLYMSACMPNLIVGTVGGGTGLPTQRQCLEMLDCYGEGKSRKFAEIVAATALAGEISIVAALCAGHFGEAHATYGRKPNQISDSVIPSPHFPLQSLSDDTTPTTTHTNSPTSDPNGKN